MSVADHRRFRASLAYDKSKGGNRGRALVQHCPALRLPELDRREPSRQAPSGGTFEEWATFPAADDVVELRGESKTRHRN